MILDHSHNPDASSWVPGADEHAEFPIQNLPLGVFSLGTGDRRIGCAIGDFILDLAALAEKGMISGPFAAALGSDRLNPLFALPGEDRLALRHATFALLTSMAGRVRIEGDLHPAVDCTMHLPCAIGDYTDFYVGIHHATNIGRQFRPDNPLLPNYKYVPIGYHGRASSVRASGEPVIRPKGQRKPPDADAPDYGPCRRLDYELELGVWIAGENGIGETVAIGSARERIAGLCLLNDWSARDLQAWEYQPLGPFLAKNFLTTVSPWVVTAEALAPFGVAQQPRPAGDPRPLPYLWDEADQASGALAVELEVHLSTAAMRQAGRPAVRLSHGPAGNMYWTMAQMIAHHASSGCNLRPGDLLGTGTISGTTRDSFGSLMEISAGGSDPVSLADGEQRAFLADGDEIVMSAFARRAGYRSIGFGRCAGMVLPATA